MEQGPCFADGAPDVAELGVELEAAAGSEVVQAPTWGQARPGKGSTCSGRVLATREPQPLPLGCCPTITGPWDICAGRNLKGKGQCSQVEKLRPGEAPGESEDTQFEALPHCSFAALSRKGVWL